MRQNPMGHPLPMLHAFILIWSSVRVRTYPELFLSVRQSCGTPLRARPRVHVLNSSYKEEGLLLLGRIIHS